MAAEIEDIQRITHIDMDMCNSKYLCQHIVIYITKNGETNSGSFNGPFIWNCFENGIIDDFNDKKLYNELFEHFKRYQIRHFKLIIDGKPCGRFSGKPKQAASKAFSCYLKHLEKSNLSIEGKIKFSIQECTRGSKYKQYNYIGERIQLNNPITVIINSKDDNETKKVISYRYNNRVIRDKSLKDKSSDEDESDVAVCEL